MSDIYKAYDVFHWERYLGNDFAYRGQPDPLDEYLEELAGGRPHGRTLAEDYPVSRRERDRLAGQEKEDLSLYETSERQVQRERKAKKPSSTTWARRRAWLARVEELPQTLEIEVERP